MTARLASDVARHVRTESYGPQPEIEGVERLPLKKHRSLEGWFMEHLRLQGGHVEGLARPFAVRQLSVSRAEPKRINAFHLHVKAVQDELWCVLDGILMVWLVDVREGSPTHGVRRREMLTAEEPCLLHVPTGVAHGYKAGWRGATLLYAMNAQFDPEDPNEGRLPWDYFGPELWEEDRG